MIARSLLATWILAGGLAATASAQTLPGRWSEKKAWQWYPRDVEILRELTGAKPASGPAPASALKEPRLGIVPGPFKPDVDSLKQYQCPEWFRDAKFGIWAVWGPQSVLEQGDWYARQMYIEGHPQYLHHLQTFGHPSKHGYKDIIPLWKAEHWDPDQLMALYQQAGAKYFVAIANHHDNFDCWNSKFHKWNSVNYGPKRDIVGQWKKAALQRGLRFGVTEHNARSYSWFQTSHGADKKGPFAGVPYDGADPRHQDLYHPPFGDKGVAYPVNPPESWTRHWFQRSQDLLDSYQPDLFYFDGGIPFGEVGRSLVAHFYNANRQWHGGKLEAVMNIKKINSGHGEYADGACVQDIERGVANAINPLPWQTDTCIGDWYYKKGIQYKSPADVVRMLADIVSKNGNLLLNVPLKGDGTLDADEVEVLKGIGAWLAVNGEAIYGTRPWKKFGEGPANTGGEHFNEGKTVYTAADIRFTASKDPQTLYAIVLNVPTEPVRIKSLAGEKVAGVALLGSEAKLNWKLDADGLAIQPVKTWSCQHAVVFKIQLSK